MRPDLSSPERNSLVNLSGGPTVVNSKVTAYHALAKGIDSPNRFGGVAAGGRISNKQLYRSI